MSDLTQQELELDASRLLLDRPTYSTPTSISLDAIDRLGPEWEKAVRDLHSTGWRR